MKKFLIGIFAVVIAFSAFAFEKSATSLTEYYWYDTDGNLLSEDPSEFSPNGCNEGVEVCAYGHIQMTSNPGVNPNKIARFP